MKNKFKYIFASIFIILFFYIEEASASDFEYTPEPLSFSDQNKF